MSDTDAKAALNEAEIKSLRGQISDLHHKLRDISAIHHRYRSSFTDEYDVCAGCSVGYPVPWPCPTARVVVGGDA